MKVLLIAPHPFYQERGTPIAVDLLLSSLSLAGHEVDLLTFPEGTDRSYKNVRIFRIRRWFGIDNIRPGFSAKKLILDFFLFFRFVALMTSNRYDVVHAVEESVFMAMIVCPLFRAKYVYDMDSSMTTQIVDKLPPLLRVVKPVLAFMESLPMRFATAVVPVCEALAVDVRRYRSDGVFVLKDVSLVSDTTENLDDVLDIGKMVGSNKKALMYIGNLESYQGIDLMVESFALAAATVSNNVLVVVGGEDQHIDEYKRLASDLDIAERVFFAGKQPVAHLSQLMSQADILLSPRVHGVNTPMKVYSYLDSGTAVLATRLPTHTQVMTDEISCLVEPNKEAMADGITALLNDDKLRQQLASNARKFIAAEHSVPVFRLRLAEIYEHLSAS